MAKWKKYNFAGDTTGEMRPISENARALNQLFYVTECFPKFQKDSMFTALTMTYL